METRIEPQDGTWCVLGRLVGWSAAGLWGLERGTGDRRARWLSSAFLPQTPLSACPAVSVSASMSPLSLLPSSLALLPGPPPWPLSGSRSVSQPVWQPLSSTAAAEGLLRLTDHLQLPNSASRILGLSGGCQELSGGEGQRRVFPLGSSTPMLKAPGGPGRLGSPVLRKPRGPTR